MHLKYTNKNMLNLLILSMLSLGFAGCTKKGSVLGQGADQSKQQAKQQPVDVPVAPSQDTPISKPSTPAPSTGGGTPAKPVSPVSPAPSIPVVPPAPSSPSGAPSGASGGPSGVAPSPVPAPVTPPIITPPAPSGPAVDPMLAQRRHFLEQSFTHLAVSSGDPVYFDLDLAAQPLRHAWNKIPIAPVVHKYHFVDVIAPLVVRFPAAFDGLVPKAIVEGLKTKGLTIDDLFFVVQKATPESTFPNKEANKFKTDDFIFFVSESDVDDYVAKHKGVAKDKAKRILAKQLRRQQQEAQLGPASLKPAYWADPTMPNLDSIKGTRFSTTMQMAIFKPTDSTIMKEVSNTWRDFAISVHDQKISSDVGHLNIDADKLNLGFWSAVISPKLTPRAGNRIVDVDTSTHKVAVTLHWLLNEDTYTIFMVKMRRAINLTDLYNRLEADATFKAAPHTEAMLKMLEKLIGR